MKPAFQYVDRQLAIARAFARSEASRIVSDCRHAIKTDPEARAVAYGGAALVYCAATLTTWAIVFAL